MTRINDTIILKKITECLDRRKQLKGVDTTSCAIVRRCIESIFNITAIHEYSNHNTALVAVVTNIKEFIKRVHGSIDKRELNLLDKITQELWDYGHEVNYGEVAIDD